MYLQEALTFEQMEALRLNGGLSQQAMKSLLHRQKEKEKSRSFKRDNKNRPMEMSSKRPVPRLREVVQAAKKCAASSGVLCNTFCLAQLLCLLLLGSQRA